MAIWINFAEIDRVKLLHCLIFKTDSARNHWEKLCSFTDFDFKKGYSKLQTRLPEDLMNFEKSNLFQ